MPIRERKKTFLKNKMKGEKNENDKTNRNKWKEV